MRHCLLFVATFLISSNHHVTSQSISCSSPGSVRILSSSSTSSSSSSSSTVGRVEYCYNSSSGNFWSTVCLQGWDLNAGHVACRSHSSTWTAYTTVPGDDYIASNLGSIVQVSCKGSESSLTQCNPTLVTFQTSSCNERQTAGVSCKSGASARDIILVGGPSEREGFVQIYDGTSWGFLTPSPGFWTSTQAQVACNQLGYSGGSIPVLATAIETGFLFNFECPSNARALSDCSDNRRVFGSGPPATLSCGLNGQGDGTLRLARSARSNGERSGVLEISYQGRYGTICSSGFSSTEANVACRQLGFGDVDTRSSVSENAFKSKPAWINDIDCSSDEFDNLFSRCTFDTPLGGECSSSRAFVTCEAAPFHGAAIAAIVITGVLGIVAFVLIIVYWKQIKIKLTEYKQRHCNSLHLDCSCLRAARQRISRPSPRATSQPTPRPSSQSSRPPAVTIENNNTNTSHPRENSDSETEQSPPRQQQQQQQQKQQQPSNPEFSSGAPPSYNVADKFNKIEEELEKPPPYIDPSVPSVPIAPDVPYLPSGPPVGPGYPPPIQDPVYPPPAVYPPPGVYPPGDAIYPPPT